MQTITIAIGKTGIGFFARQFLSGQILGILGTLSAPTRDIAIKDFHYTVSPGTLRYIQNLSVMLYMGEIQHYSPTYTNISQGNKNGVAEFTLSFPSEAFNAHYRWRENYNWYELGRSTASGNDENKAKYDPAFSGLLVTVTVQFAYQEPGGWQISVQKTTGKASPGNTTLPSNSVLNYQTEDCSGYHFDQTTALAIQNMDFATPVNSLITGVLKSIPGSGDLGNGILYDFSIGDGGIAFPNNDGIQLGAKGGASYDGTPFPGSKPPSLPFPAPLTDGDTHHLNMYVSNYEVDALNWAFFKAGKLNTVVDADQIADPDILKVKTYVPVCPLLKPYEGRSMEAQVVPLAAPATAFQLVYELTAEVMAILSKQLSSTDYQNLSGLQGNNYVSKADLEADLSNNNITPSSYVIIEKAAKTMGVVVTHDIRYTLVIQDFQPVQPTIEFQVKRTDILSGLQLGLSGADGKHQTLQFQFTNVDWTVTFISSTVKGLNGMDLENIWLNAGEPQYVLCLQAIGKTGVALPMMQDFQFDFANAELSIQEGYVSILANILYNSSN